MSVAKYTPREDPILLAVLWTGDINDLNGFPEDKSYLSRMAKLYARPHKDYIVRGVTGLYRIFEKEEFERTYIGIQPPTVYVVLEWLDGSTRVPIAVYETLKEAQGMCNAFRDVVAVPWHSEEVIAPPIKYILTTDGDAHWFVIPTDKKAEWSAFREAAGKYWDDMPEDQEAPVQPDWAIAVGGAPSLVQFSNYEIA